MQPHESSFASRKRVDDHQLERTSVGLPVIPEDELVVGILNRLDMSRYATLAKDYFDNERNCSALWCVVGGCYKLISVVLIHQCLLGLLVSAPSLLCEGRGFEPPLGRGKTTAGADITYDQHEIDSLLHRLVAAIATFSAERMYQEVRGQSIPAIRSMAARDTEHAYVQIVSESSANEKCIKRELAGMRFPSVGDAMDIVNSGTNFE